MPLRTEWIQQTFAKLFENGQIFLIEFVGSPGKGLRQTISEPSQYIMLVTELIERCGGLDTFFTKS